MSETPPLTPAQQDSKPWLGYAVAGGIGALVAAGALWLRAPAPTAAPAAVPPPVVAGGGAQHAAAAPIRLERDGTCHDRCCPGRDPVANDPYRMRITPLQLTAAAEAQLAQSQRPVDLCIGFRGESPACLPAFSPPLSSGALRVLERVVSTEDLLEGLTAELRYVRTRPTLAKFKKSVVVNDDVMCKGISIQLHSGTGVFATTTAFLDPAHYVELGARASTAELAELQRRFTFHDMTPLVFETSRAAPTRYVLAVGPFNRRQAQMLQWFLLHQQQTPAISYGLDFTGEALQEP